MTTALVRDGKGGTYVPLVASIIYLGVIVLWSIQVPFNEAPDEVTHFFFPEYLAKFRSFPVLGHTDLRFLGPFSGSEYWTKGEWYIGSAFLHSLGGAITGLIGSPLLGSAYAFLGVRAFNWIMGAIACAALTAIAMKADGPPAYRAGVVVAVLAIPQVTFIFAYFNHDAMGFAAGSTLLYLSGRLSTERPSRSLCCSIGLALGIISLSKVYYWPIAVFVIAREVTRQTAFGGAKKDHPFPLALFFWTLFPCILIALPFHIWNVVHYGDFTGAAVNRRFHYLHPEMTPQAYDICFLFCRSAIVDIGQLSGWLWTTFQSFYGVFGYMSLPMSRSVYIMLFAPASVLLLILLCLPLLRVSPLNRRALPELMSPLLAIGMLLCLLLISVWNSQTFANQPQGRYLFAFLPVLASSLLNRDQAVQPHFPWKRWKTACVITIAIPMIWLNEFALTNILAHAYAGLSTLRSDLIDPPVGIIGANSTSTGLAVDFRSTGRIAGNVERIELTSPGHFIVSGWAADPAADRPADAIFIFGRDHLLATAVPSILRLDVSDALSRNGTKRSGFFINFGADPAQVRSVCDLQVLAASISGGVTRIFRNAGSCSYQ